MPGMNIATHDVFAVNALFCVNTQEEPDEDRGTAHPTFQRLLWVAPGTDDLVMIEVPAARAFPFWTTRDALLAEVAAGRLIPQELDPFAPPALPDDGLSLRARDVRARRWRAIEPLVTDPARRILTPHLRGALVAQASAASAAPRDKVYRYLRLYWQGAQTPNALLPAYDHCGGRGKPRAAGAAKRGRPSHLARADASYVGINVDNEVCAKLLRGARRFVERDKLPLRRAYDETIRTYFHVGHEWRDGHLVPVLPPPDLLPTLGQFTYWYGKERTTVRAVRARVGERRFNLSHRPALATSTEGVSGPGALYQVDATVGDLYLLSGVVSGRVIGRPVIYLVVDAFSRMIVGFHVGLEGPSWLGIMLALENAFTDKVEFCRRHGRAIDAADWPCHHLPEALLGDRGELLSHHADHLAAALNIRVSNAAPWRADWKGIVERSFRTINDEMIAWQPGAVLAPRERGGVDYRLDATLTLADFVRMMIALVLHYNHHRPLAGEDAVPHGYPYPTDGDPTPIDLWIWGAAHRAGYLKTASRDRIRANLLPSADATLTGRGFRFAGLHYAPLDLIQGLADASDPLASS